MTADDLERVRIKVHRLLAQAEDVRSLLRVDEEFGGVMNPHRTVAIVQMAAAIDALELAGEALERWG